MPFIFKYSLSFQDIEIDANNKKEVIIGVTSLQMPVIYFFL